MHPLHEALHMRFVLSSEYMGFVYECCLQCVPESMSGPYYGWSQQVWHLPDREERPVPYGEFTLFTNHQC